MIYYLVGIKGAGMSALALCLSQQGHIVKGVDSETFFYTQKKLNDFCVEDFTHMNLKKSYFYIIGNAYVNHSLFKTIKRLKYKYMLYPQFIYNYFKDYSFISVCGSHGKTTTTKMLSELIDNASYIIGDGSGNGHGSQYFIMESCEYRDTFLNYYPKFCLILNIDYDHPDYFKTKDDYILSYKKFSEQSMVVVANGDDENINKIKADYFITYGINDDNDVKFSYQIKNNGMDVFILGQSFFIPLFGKHYAYDFVGAYLISKLCGLTDEDIISKIKNFKLPSRRLTIKKSDDLILIHDYAHHPTEISSVYETLKIMYPNYKIKCFFQPHTISRSEALALEFKRALGKFDEVFIIRTFTSVREEADLIKEAKIYKLWDYKVINLEDISIKKFTNTIYLFLGAGDIDLTFEKLVKMNIKKPN